MGCSSFAIYCFQMGITVMGFAEHFGLSIPALSLEEKYSKDTEHHCIMYTSGTLKVDFD